MLLNIPQINFVDVLVFGEDASVVSTARRLRSGGFGVAVFLTGAAQEAGLDSGALGELIGSGADLLLETTPVAPLVSGGRWLSGWVVLCSSGYLAVPARAVVDATRGRLLASQVPPGVCGLVDGTLEDNPQLVDIEQLSELEAIPVKTSGAIDSWAAGTELVWHYESPRYAGCSRRLPLEFAGAHSATATEVLVVGGGQSGLAAAKAARAKGAQVLCIDATAGIFPEEVPVLSGVRLGGVLRCGRRISGVLVWDRSGRSRVIHAEVVLDATGNALVAHAAGAPVSPLVPETVLTYGGWGASLGVIHLDADSSSGVPYCLGDAVDSTRAQVFELVRGSRYVSHPGERRRIVGELVVQPQDVILERRYQDTIAVVHGAFGEDGAGSLALLLGLVPRGAVWSAWLPLRALLPVKMEGLLTIGRGASVHWDLLPFLQSAEERARLGVAAGLVAASAVRLGCPLRQVPLRPVQEELVSGGLLPSEVLRLQEDENGAVLNSDRLALYQVAVILQRPDRTRRQLQAAFAQHPAVLLAELLAFLGDSSGRDLLKRYLEGTSWESVSAEGGGLETAILALRDIGGGGGVLLHKLSELSGASPFRQLRAVCLYLQRWPLPEAAAHLERILTSPGFAGHARAHAEDSPAEHLAQMREIYVAGALNACAPDSKLAMQSLRAYCGSPRLLQAVFSKAMMVK